MAILDGVSALLIVAFARFAPGRGAARCGVFRRDRLVSRSCGVLGRTKDPLCPASRLPIVTTRTNEVSAFCDELWIQPHSVDIRCSHYKVTCAAGALIR